NAPASSMARTSYPSPSYETSDMMHLSPPYQFNPMTFPSSSNQFAPMIHPSPSYQHAHSTPINESEPVVHSSPTYQATPATPATVRGRGRQKCYWEESETQLLVEVLQEMTYKKISCERDWYLKYCENHKEANGLWDFPFPYFNQLELVYERDRATGTVVEGFKDAIHNMENEQNGESRGDNIGGSHISLSDDEEVDVQTMASVVANAMTDDNNLKKAKSKQLKDALDELTKLNIRMTAVVFQLKFNSIKDAKQLLEAVEKRFGENAATKKTQRNLLKQQFENFFAQSSEMLDQTFDRLQKLASQLELLGEKLS
nr:hypothetical protein [Tanacetum cinerariifolium]